MSRYSTHQLVDNTIAVVRWEKGKITEIVGVYYRSGADKVARDYAVTLNRKEGVYEQ